MTMQQRVWSVVLCTLGALALSATCGCGPDALESFGATAVEIGVLPQSAKIQGRDGGRSGVVWGRAVWTYGDTVLNAADERGSNWHNNSFSIADDLDASDNIAAFQEASDSTGAPRPFIDATAEEQEFNTAHQGDACAIKPCGARWAVWPGQPLWDAPRNRALVFYGLIYAEPGDYNFHGVGTGVSVWNDITVSPERPVVMAGTAHPTLMFGDEEPVASWGTAALIDEDWLYVFACDGDPFGPACSLARVPPAEVLDRGAWRFWDGGAWSESMARRKSLFAGAPTVTVGYSAHLRVWMAIYAQPLTTDVAIRTAPALTGPWSAAKLLFVAAKKGGGAYDTNWHPELDQQGGKIVYVTFSRPTGKGWFGAELALVRVTLP